MGTTARSPRYRWKEGKEADLREFVEGRVLQGASITQALKEYAEKNRISWLTARWKYYQVRNQGTEGRESRVERQNLPQWKDPNHGKKVSWITSKIWSVPLRSLGRT